MKKVFYTIVIVAAIVSVTIYANTLKSGPNSLGHAILYTMFKPSEETKILFVGDMFFDRYIRQVGQRKGEDFIFSCIKNFLKDFDLVVGNLEGPITDNPSISLGTEIGSLNNYVFTFPSSTAKLLADNNIRIVNLGGNHIDNFGPKGIASTKKYLGKAGVNYFGGIIGDESTYLANASGAKISFVSYNEFSGAAPERIAQKISEEKADNRMVLVYAHWGDEYSEIPEHVKDAAKLFAKSGADLIVGSHPHIILPSEYFSFAQDKEAVVYYSLGNFIFDQYWDEQVKTGLVLEVKIKNGNLPDGKAGIDIIEHRVSLLSDGRTCLQNSFAN